MKNTEEYKQQSDLYNPFSPNSLAKTNEPKASGLTNFMLEVEDENEEEFQDFQQGNQLSHRGNMPKSNTFQSPIQNPKENTNNQQGNSQIQQNILHLAS